MRGRRGSGGSGCGAGHEGGEALEELEGREDGLGAPVGPAFRVKTLTRPSLLVVDEIGYLPVNLLEPKAPLA